MGLSGLGWGYRGLDVAGAHLGGGQDAGAAQLPYPTPRTIIYLQQNSEKHLAGESIPLTEKQVSGVLRGWEGRLDPAI